MDTACSSAGSLQRPTSHSLQVPFQEASTIMCSLYSKFHDHPSFSSPFPLIDHRPLGGRNIASFCVISALNKSEFNELVHWLSSGRLMHEIQVGSRLWLLLISKQSCYLAIYTFRVKQDLSEDFAWEAELGDSKKPGWCWGEWKQKEFH